MPKVIGVVFRETGKIHYFEPGDYTLLPGDNVIVETSQGTEFAEVVMPPENISDSEVISSLKKVVRKATEEDHQKREELKALEKDASKVCQEKISKHGLDMKLVEVECLFDESKMIFYFSAETRVDFRDLVKDLASAFRKRIELKQIGVRDEAKMIGGLGSCGRGLCCNTFLKDFEPISIKFAKEQNLPLNPFKISGICGRLMCCLRYEYEQYKEFNRKAPKRGDAVKTEHGEGVVVDYNMPRSSVVVEIDDGFKYDVPIEGLKTLKRRSKPKEKKENENDKDRNKKDKNFKS